MPYATALFFPSVGLAFGGAEIRAKTFAEGLARRSRLAVTCLVINDGTVADSLVDLGPALRVLARPAGRQGNSTGRNRGLVRRLSDRFRAHCLPPSFLPFDRGGFDAWDRASSDIYCAFGVSDYAASLAAYCRENGRRFVLFLASDQDVAPTYRHHSLALNPYGSRAAFCRFAIDTADLLVAQSPDQARMLAERFGRASIVVANPVADMAAARPGYVAEAADEILWIGKSDHVKQPARLIQLARANPDVRFRMVLNRADASVFAECMAELPANVVLLERFDPENLHSIYSRAAILVNTSAFEGFPNTFLEAGCRSLPILSLNVDPAGILELGGAGRCAGGSMAKLDLDLKELMGSRALREEMGRNARDWVMAKHNADARCAELEHALLSLSPPGTAGSTATGRRS